MTATIVTTRQDAVASLVEPLDEALLTAIAGGEHAAFAQLYDRYSRLAFALR